MSDSAPSTPIRYWRYALRPRTALNARSAGGPREGALLRIGEGHACVQPWPELGDAPLEAQLAALARGGETPLLRQARRCAERDAEARRAGRSLFDGLPPIPASHHLALPGDEPGEIRELGFDRVKLKIGRDPAAELAEIARWTAAGFRPRLDANESFDASSWCRFWSALGSQRERVEFVEDPCRYDPGIWRRLQDEEGVPLAVDREVEERWQPGAVAVLKPALSSWVPPSGTRCVVTTYLDHALGQAWAASEAARLSGSGERAEIDGNDGNDGVAPAFDSSHRSGPSAPPESPESPGLDLLTCGLLTHRCYEPDPFFESLCCEGPRLSPPAGTGLGFDDLLADLPWKALT